MVTGECKFLPSKAQVLFPFTVTQMDNNTYTHRELATLLLEWGAKASLVPQVGVVTISETYWHLCCK